ncbi:MAG TPA: pitrilysin family protein [Blastocatellia bacterium]|nr:pitrilysin family protein [Blastocatellia bacterium]
MTTRLNVKVTLIVLVATLLGFGNQTAIARGGVAGRARTPHRSEQSEGWRKQTPAPGPNRSFHLPAAQVSKLENGLTLVMIEDHRAPMVTIDVGIPSRVAASQSLNILRQRSALAEATAQLLTEGAGNRSSEQLAREVETLGGRIASAANDDYIEVNAAVVAENAEPMMKILGDVLLRPAFPQNEMALYKSNRIDKLKVDRQEPSFLLSEHFNRIVYGAHPYSITTPTPAAIKAMTRAKIASFYKSNYTPDGSVIVIAGDFDPAKMKAKARTILGAWKKPASAISKRPSVVTANRTARRVYLIDRPGSEQADFRVGGLATTHSSPDYFPLIVANAILGAERAGSRLFLNIREQKGYTYDVFSVVSALKQGGAFFGGSETRNEVTLPAIKEMLAEFDRMRNERVSAEELQNAKNYLNGTFSLALSTQGGITQGIVQSYMLGLGGDYLQNYRARIEAVTAEQVQQAARKYMADDLAAIVVVGDAARLKKELSPLGHITVLDGEGNPKK